MSDFAAMRTNMVECQIRTNGVIDGAVLDVFETLPREVFVPQEKQATAYVDKPVALIQGRSMLDPMTHARMVEALDLKSDDVALDVGTCTGYSAAVLASLVTTVLSVETRQALIDKAVKNLDQVGVYNVVVEKGKFNQGLEDKAPFDVIFINGAVAKVPDSLLDQLAEGGRLVAIERESEMAAGQAVLYVRVSKENVQRKVLFDANVPYLNGFEPEETFSF